MYHLRKLNGRLYIVNGAGDAIYTYPNFITLHTRAELQMLVDDLNGGEHYIVAVIAWETMMSPLKKFNKNAF